MTPDRRPPPAITCTGVSKTFASSAGGGFLQAVAPIDLTFAAGKTTALVGPSGCGKSTLLRMIAGLEEPSTGSIDIGGAPPASTLKRADLSIAFQDPSLLPWRTVRGNIELALKLASRPANAQAVDDLIEMVGLDGFADVRPAELSGGMRQRAAIARALVIQPRVLLLDEPFGAVDELTRQQLAEDLPKLWEALGTTTLLVTHSVSEAVLLSDRILALSPRPAGIVADIRVDLPRPRRPEDVREPACAAYISRVFSALSEGIAANARPQAAQ